MVTCQPRVEVPACAGGSAVRDNFLSFSQPKLTEEEINAVAETLRSGWLTTAAKTCEFENNFSEYIGTDHAVALNSCTAGLFLSLRLLDIGPGDEVITTPLTFAATVNVIEHTGATPVFADIEPSTCNIDPEQIKKIINDSTRAIIPVHLYGRPCDMSALGSIVEKHGLKLIQDCAHAIESEWEGRNLATYGDLACYSFYATKNVTTGEGGMVATNRKDWADRLRVMALHGLDVSAYDRYSSGGKALYDLQEPGYKFNMPDITASLGIEGLKRIEERHERRSVIWNIYCEGLSDIHGLILPPEPAPGMKHARHLFVCTLDPEITGIDRDSMIDALTAENIGTGVHYTPVHFYSYYRKKYKISHEDLPVASRIGERIFSLPLTPYLDDKDVEDVIHAVKRILHYYSRKN